MPQRFANRVLIKVRGGQLGIADGGQYERLFELPTRWGTGVAEGTAAQWLAVSAGGTADAWAQAHEAAAQARSDLGADVFAEPELEGISPSPPIISGAAIGMPSLPAEFAWYRGDDYTQLDRALAHSLIAASRGAVRVAQLDTGYDPHHATFKTIQYRTDLQRNFIDKSRPGDARDEDTRNRPGDVMNNLGHGASTAAILAAGPALLKADGRPAERLQIGCCPRAEVIPLRTGNGVVQWRSGAVAEAIHYAAQLCDTEATRVHVMTMSMGGVASQAWADAVNLAYERGIFFAAAAGNNYNGLPTRNVVFPALFKRVTAVCGAMSDGNAYAHLDGWEMEGNYGPRSKMEAAALAAYTPQMPWVGWGSGDGVSRTGGGTSSATPQVAAAAALYVLAYGESLSRYPEAWMRVEAIRHALFTTAMLTDAQTRNGIRFGRGTLRAFDMLEVPPPAPAQLWSLKSPADSGRFGFWRTFLGLGVAGAADEGVEAMFELELSQLVQGTPSAGASANPYDEDFAAAESPAARDPSVQARHVRSMLETAADDPRVSPPLREWVRSRLGASAPSSARNASPVVTPADVPDFVPTLPTVRRLRCYATDPALSASTETSSVGRATLAVRWEPLSRGPVGEYLEVVDVDRYSATAYEPIDLDHPHVLATDGLTPSEGVPQFHQQMVYAVAMKTIEQFESALGRTAMWVPRMTPDKPRNDSRFVRRLRIYPHAFRGANAYYDRRRVALLFGYFAVGSDVAGGFAARSRVFSCLSHDIIAHETTHALLDGMHRQFLLQTNPDVLAFHEAFADVVALFQRFQIKELLVHQIAQTRGQLRDQHSVFGELAVQFGKAMGRQGALRQMIGRVEDGQWKPIEADPDALAKSTGPHERGAILVAAIFDAFLTIYDRATRDLYRIATEGTGVLRPGAIHPDLVNRLADEAAGSAQAVLRMCIRALDYCPPTDITFGEYLRALITADYDANPADECEYRTAFVEAFRRRGIYPPDIATLGAQSLRWRGPDEDRETLSEQFNEMLEDLRAQYFTLADRRRRKADPEEGTRERTFRRERSLRAGLHQRLTEHFKSSDGQRDARYFGINPQKPFEVHSLRFALRGAADSSVDSQILIGILQSSAVAGTDRNSFEGGATLVCDLRRGRVRYCIRKRVDSPQRLARARAFAAQANLNELAGDPYRPFDPDKTFQWLHGH